MILFKGVNFLFQIVDDLENIAEIFLFEGAGLGGFEESLEFVEIGEF